MANQPGMNITNLGIANAEELSSQKKLYVINLALKKAGINQKILFRFPLIISGLAEWSMEGPWSTTMVGAVFLGQSRGWWETAKDSDGTLRMWLYNEETPNRISYLWRDWPASYGMLEGILKYPLALGETGTGAVTYYKPGKFGEGRPYYDLGWKVTERTF